MKYLDNFIIFLIIFYAIFLHARTVISSPQADSWQEIHEYTSDIILNSTFPDKIWWEQFNDEHLKNYIACALANNFSLKAAVARINQARALVGESKSLLRPSVSTFGEYQRIHSSDTTSFSQAGNESTRIPVGKTVNLYTFPMQASYELDIFGKNRTVVKSAQKYEEEIQANKKVIELTLVSEVASTYFNLIQTDAMIKTTESLIDTTSQSLQLRRQLFTGGVIPYDTVLLTEQDLASFRQNLAQYKSQRAIFAHELNILIATKPQNTDQLKRSSLDQILIPCTINTGIPSELLNRRPDIIQAELAMERAHINVSEARRQFFPTINLGGQFGFSSRNLSQLFDWKSRIYQFGGSVIQSLYAGGYKTANLKYQKAVLDEQLNNYYTVLLLAFGDVENSLALFKDNYAEYQENLCEIKTSEKYVGLTKIRYNSGIGTRLDYLDAERQLLAYQLLSQQNKSRSLVNIVSLYKALGGGYTP